MNGDWLLIYKIEQKNLILTLVRTGSHKNPSRKISVVI
ncbi:type II toxin-antitoxin system mRNA interferase toxin, RelE/StbE family [Lacticaseibacillus rhamnosus]|nr:type II toxin-antitoxin system mRNA interferase toxin, RelE/StbE family [Lacticaseibacillus rhamnosus]MDK8383938.1 type II toxin-antitoxin system mRNA interferase toxin, RelE/StbE family [Lacticaseibacillus rhamnosus]MDK8750104.1 type II toxin-antitoxin system mRNA interferase toxin, RelE/StbE family [Lacticaseibacillus rhamnosus]UUT37956.1 type II toxin-antitoxin system mRNA interferase toxin, RelE/StbE family [Lacticaseibacillus rhamnosus]